MEDSINVKQILTKYVYYVLITILSIASFIVFPIIGAASSSVEISACFPDSTLGWTLWLIVRGLIISLNLIIFSSFINQSRINVLEDKNYKEAVAILRKTKSKDYIPKSPKQFLSKQYMSKGTGLVTATVASLFAIGSAVINYDWMLLVATVFTVILSVVFGIITMKKCEIYYTSEYLDFAKYIEQQNKNKEEEAKNIIQCINNLKENLHDYSERENEEKSSGTSIKE